MQLPEDYDIAVDLPANIKLGNEKVLKIVGAIATDETQVIFVKTITEEEYLEEIGAEE